MNAAKGTEDNVISLRVPRATTPRSIPNPQKPTSPCPASTPAGPRVFWSLAMQALAFRAKGGAVLFPMTPATKRAKTTDGALRAAKQIESDPSFIESSAEIIDCETGVREVLDILENIIAEAGDLIESRSPELVAQARAALRCYADEAPRQAK